MKAVIVELNGKYAAVLSDDGCISKMKNNHYKIGQVIEMSEIRDSKKTPVTKIAAIAASFVLVCAAGGWGVHAYTTPSTYVSLDVNPSIEYSLNLFDRVLSVKAVNDDGKEILDQINLEDLKNKTIDEAIQTTVDEISKNGFFDGSEEGGIMITTSGKDLKKSARLAEKLSQVAKDKCDKEDKDVTVECDAVGRERVEAAKALGVTPGKLRLIEKLKESSANPDEINVEEWLNKPVKDIMKATKENRKANKDAGKGNGKNTTTSISSSETTTITDENGSQVTTTTTTCDSTNKSKPSVTGKENEKTNRGQNKTTTTFAGSDQTTQTLGSTPSSAGKTARKIQK